MTKNEKKELLESHKPVDEDAAKRYEDNPPRIVDKLEYQPGEGVVGELPEGDFKQLITRYLNDFGVLLRNVVHFQLRTEKVLEFIAKNQGIDLAKEFKEDAKAAQLAMEQHQEAVKQALKDCGKN